MFTPVLAKHTKSFNLIDTLAVGVDRIQRNFEPLRRQVELWRTTQVTDERAKLIFYNAFIDGALDAPRSFLPEVHRLYFEPDYPESSARTMWSQSNAFTSAFKKLDPIPQFKATAKLVSMPTRWRLSSSLQTQIADERAKLILYTAFVDGKLDAPKSLLSGVHRLYFEPQCPEFSPRTMWSLSNAFTSDVFRKFGLCGWGAMFGGSRGRGRIGFFQIIMFRSLQNDLIFTLRQLRRAPGFAVIVIATLALGIGVTTAVYSLVDGVLLRPFPLLHPEQLMALFTLSREPGGDVQLHRTSWPDLRDWQTHSHTFAGLAGVFPDYRLVNREDGGGGAVIPVNRVSFNYFDVLEVQPAMGRGFVMQDEQSGHHVAVLSYGFWQRALGSDKRVLGRTIRISNEPYTVIGVMPRRFVEPREETAEVWTSIALLLEGATPRAKIRDDAMAEVVGRLRPGVTVTQAQAELSAIQAGLAANYHEIRYQTAVGVDTVLEYVGYKVRARLYLLLAAVFAVLLIVCTNVSGLVLTRAARRSGEAALRTALGASQWRVWRQMLIEGLVIGGCGGVLGAALAWGLLHVTLPAIPQDIPRMAEIGMSWRVLFFAAAISLVCALASSVAPAWKLARAAPVEALRAQGKQTTEGRTARRLQSALVVVQTTLGVALLIGSGFLIRGFVNVLDVHAGFRADHLFTFLLPLTEARYPHKTRALFYHELIAKLAAMPGVRSASGGYPLPMLGWGASATVEVDGRPNPPGHEMSTLVGVAEPGFFETLGVPLLRGRLFTAADDDAKAPLVAVVNEAFAKRYFAGEDPVGRVIRPDIREIRNQAIDLDPQGDAQREIVGVISDTAQDSLTEPAEPFAVYPYAQATELMRPRLLMRVAGDPMQSEKAAAALVQRMDPELFLQGPRSMEMQLGLMTGTQRFETLLIAGFSAIALFLTSLGFYSMLAAMVTARTREIGVRMAVGAARSNVARLILMRTAVLLAAGAAAGGTIAAAALRVLDRSDWAHELFFGVSWGDPRMIAAFVAVLTLVALSGCLLPTWQATQVDPMRALRSE